MTVVEKPKFQAQRKRKPKWLAVINECCSACAGSPVCQELCPIDECMVLIPDEKYGPGFGRITVDPLLCIGCRKCISRGPDGTYLDGCPWDAIDMVVSKDYEAEHGALPY